MFRISSADVFCASKNLIKSFCDDALIQNQRDCFSSFFIYINSGVLVGYLNVQIVFDIVEIDYIYVDNNFKRQGISNKLFSLFQDVCQHSDFPRISKFILEVSDKNIPALSLYKKFNFKEISIRKSYYKNGDDAVIMEKIL
ncbi:GNAT family N-acetyltransferase [Silvanigrella aquatica]|uniref:N-acetyltransferase domain-containing protein n=1 Tax=Silvanigrella aquatica TaxID=1915309 RepID=A0A1L4CX74_9BACT|nr:GNAT family N-acetyltransferase [Silvanigrella aquatica]APJ02550.1 hypothetical protein AXG55_00815 [Silvanigrella aquatica]